MTKNIAVIDASAVLALAKNESGADWVAGRIGDCLLSTVNLAEIVSKLKRHSVPVEQTRGDVLAFVNAVVPFDEEQAHMAGVLHSQTRALKLSYADCACLGLAMSRRLPVITADRKWGEVNLDLRLEFIR
jgi:PIN domain nuclease of toxin-antitoxin system